MTEPLPQPAPELDLRKPLPDRAHEALRQSVVKALDDLAAQVQRVTDLKAADDAMKQEVSAVNTRAEAAQINGKTALAGVDALQKVIADVEARLTAADALQVTVADLASRLAAVEKAIAPAPAPAPTL